MRLSDFLTAEAVNRVLPQINPNIDLEQKAAGNITAANMKWLQKLLTPANIKFIEKLMLTAINYGKTDIDKLKAVEIRLVSEIKEDTENETKNKTSSL